MVITCIRKKVILITNYFVSSKLLKNCFFIDAEMMKLAERKPKCLLVYSPSHMAHVNTMIDLARYLRCCNINAMIDTLDIPESTNKVQNSVYFNRILKNFKIRTITNVSFQYFRILFFGVMRHFILLM